MSHTAPATPSTAAPVAGNDASFDWRAFAASDWGDRAIGFAAAIAILLVGWWLARWAVRLLDRALVRVKVDEILRSFLRNVAFVALMVVVFIAALQKLGIPTTSLLAMVGAAGLAIGLALKDSLSNIASGVMLILLRPFKAGDSVKVGGLEGVVEQVRIFTTRLRTYSNEVIVMPNSEITTGPIVNLTGKPLRRADIKVAIGYDERIDRVRDILLALAKAHPKVLSKPSAEVAVDALAASGIELFLRAWIRTEDYGQARSDLIEAAHRELTAAGVEITSMQRELRLTTVEQANTRALQPQAQRDDVV